MTGTLFYSNMRSSLRQIILEVPQGSLLAIGPVLFVFFIGKLLFVYEEKDLGLVILDKLTWDTHLHLITAKANKLLGLLKRSCPMLTKEAVGKSL